MTLRRGSAGPRARQALGPDGLPDANGPAEAPQAGAMQDAARARGPVEDGPEALARQARTQAFRRLSRRESSRHELIQWLSSRGFSEDVAMRCADELEADGILSDDRYCEAVVHRQLREGRGPHHIEGLLRRAGITDSRIDQWVDMDEDTWLERLHAQIERLDLRSLPPWPDRARAGERLVRRGYPRAWVSRVLQLDMEVAADD